MNARSPEDILFPDVEPCLPRGACQSYRPGHHLHVIPAGHMGESPWGWRPARVVAVGERVVDLAYLDGTPVWLWHHQDLRAELRVGEAVRVHEGGRGFNFAEHVLNVAIGGGLGTVPRPSDGLSWRGLMQRGLVNMATGRGALVDAVLDGLARLEGDAR